MDFDFDAYDTSSECYENNSDDVGTIDCDSYIESQSF